MISVDEAKAAIRRALTPLPPEHVALEEAYGRVLAAPVVAMISQPPFDASAMDGYAVRLADAAAEGAILSVIGVSSAGEGFRGRVCENAAVRIYTGAPIPEGADHVLIQEEAERASDKIIVKAAQTRAQHVRPLGVDFRLGEILLPENTRLDGPSLALAAAGNVSGLSVRRRPRIAIIANGDELAMPGAALAPDNIVCSIPFGLAPMIEAWGGEARFAGVARDDPASIRRLAQDALNHDIIVPIGGASVGDRDFVRAVFSDLGFSTVFEEVSVKPGKPAWFALAGATAVLGLPGNPASALVTARLFLKPAVDQLLGLKEDERGELFKAHVSLALKENGPRETYLRARLASDPDGSCSVTPFDNQDSSLLSIMARSNVLIRRAANAPPTAAGSLVDCLPL